jgi:hypothetical protein
MNAKTKWSLGFLWPLRIAVWLFCGICACGDSGPGQEPPPPVAVAGDWAGVVFGWRGWGIPEADTTTVHFLLAQRWDLVSGAFRVGRQAGDLLEGSVHGDSVRLTFHGPESGQGILFVGRVSATMIQGRWRKVDLQNMQVYLSGPWHARRM